ncbi:serine/threonine-protein kinase [Streptomyces mangrovisoli]|uniref:Protein kinase domain-containing protein n=1 Tax=Streptomyces mangrovisoli TaxID=1428628 RepID=A0A1J4P5D7_9ACTN|nr:serine/threonine-protein kinase [Streptomyces mangrovisoli]OIJ69784.1 hypothetical protein WN71_000950 [Streptomyces mangrovisoli]
MRELGAKDPRECGGHRLVGRLGAGGMGVVYLGEDTEGRRVAVKILRPELADDPGFLRRFEREARALATLDTPHVVRVLELSAQGEDPYLITEYVPGGSLAERLDAGPLEPEAAVALAHALAVALTAIHAAGIVHRDLKPSNVLLGPDGPKVIDFGIAQLADASAVTRTGWRLGTPGYLAPEQLATGAAGPAADVFTWGLVVAAAGLGRHPFGTGPAEALAYRIQHTEPDLNGLPPSLLRAVRGALQKDPARRPAAGDLPGLLQEQSFTATPTGVVTTTDADAGAGPRQRRRLIYKALGAAAVSAALSFGLLHFLPGHDHATPGAAAGSSPTSTTTASSSSSPPPSAGTASAEPAADASESPAGTPSASVRAATEVNTFTPWTFGEPADDISVVRTESGSCFAASSSATRVDAYRCTVGDDIKDPCFSPPNDLSPAVLCPYSGPIGKVLKIRLTEPLPDALLGDEEPYPFKIVLADGQVCDSYQGSGIAIAGETMSFGCPDGDLFGAPHSAGPTWTMNYRPKGASSFRPVDIAAVYE